MAPNHLYCFLFCLSCLNSVVVFSDHNRELISNSISSTMKLAQHDNMNPTTTPAVTVPSINPGVANTNQPASPMNNPIVTTPILVPSTNPGSPPTVPTGNPVAVPSTTPPTNPPMPPVGTIPITPPINPLPPPAIGSPSGAGQWCVAKAGVPETALQAGIDYACGIADCSAIQVSGSCYNPNTRQNHASYAFNSYYHKNPSPLSCDFKGAAALTNTNPSVGSCIYPSLATAASGGGTPPPAPTSGGTPPFSAGGAPPATGGIPTTGVTPAVGGTAPAIGGTPSSGSMPTLMPPPFSLNSSIPGASGPTGFGTGIDPPSANNSVATVLQPLCAYIVLASCLLTGVLMVDA
ncbi:hypothetical protein Sjap_007165 [Stephania japonica]|uniref:X8 domain-containing protein n=1 Tax=Stephania japonica TaxID=461633 RepID=A0AAP0PD94_9MAGN